MIKNTRLAVFVIFLILVMCASMTNFNSAFADDGVPPTTAPVVTEVTPTDVPAVSTDAAPTDAPVVATDAAPTDAPVVATDAAPTDAPVVVTDAPPTDAPTQLPTDATPAPTDIVPTDAPVTNLLAQVPDTTNVVVLDANGNPVTLASQTAADIVQLADPIWCPNGIAPIALTGGCTNTYSSLSALIANLPNTNTPGTIWIQSGADSSGSNPTISGATLPTLALASLTLQGGWNGTSGSMTVNHSTPSTFTRPITITGWTGNIFVNDITINNVSSANGLTVNTAGNINLTNTSVTNEAGNFYTAQLTSSAGDITVQAGPNGNTFSGNGNTGNNNRNRGFSATASGSIDIAGTSTASITFRNAYRNGGTGYNGATLSAPTVTLSYVTARRNDGNGIAISNASLVTLNNVSAAPATNGEGNGQSGVLVNGTGSTIVAVTGGTFADNNGGYGIEVHNGTLYVTSATCPTTGNTSNNSGCYLPANPATIPGPSLSLPGNMTVEATGPSGASVSFSASATDFAGRSLGVSCSPASGSTFAIATTTVNCSATDSLNNTTSGSFTITVRDTTPPVVTVPSNMTVEATGPSGAAVTFTPTPSAADLVDGTVSVSCDHSAGTFPLGTTTVTCSATDAHGNKGSASFTVKVQDTTAPTLTLPGNITTEATGPSGAAVTFAPTPSATDLVDGTVAVSCDHSSGDTFPVGTTAVNCSATDAAGNIASGSFDVTVVDTTAPTLTLPGTITKEATSGAGATATFIVSATDIVDGSVAVNCDYTSGDTFPLGTTTVNCSATDAAGNTASGSFDVTVVDTTAPTLTLPGTITKEATSGAGVAATFVVSATDIVDGSVAVNCDYTSGDVFPLGTTTVNCSATDVAGNKATGSFDVTVVDTTAPTLTLPGAITKEATSGAGAAATFAVSATDIVDGSVAVSCDYTSGDVFPLGTTTVNCSATDAAGNTATGSFDVVVVDTTAPTLTLPGTITKEATSGAGAAATFVVSATDIVDGSVAVSCDYTSGDTFPLGTTTVNCSATDAAGNKATGSFDVTVVDTTAPVVTVPANITKEATGSSGAIVTFTVSATDIVDGTVVVSCDHSSGDTFPIGDTLVTCSATDAHGNTGSASFTIKVQDTAAPVVTVPADITIEATGPSGAVATFTASAFDIVDGALTPTCSPDSGSTFAIGTSTVTCSATDSDGNTGTASFTVTVQDTTAPVVTVPSNMTVEATSSSGAVVTFTASASDIVDGALTPTCSPDSGSTFGLGTTTVNCSATDAHENMASASFDVTVQDTTPPTIASHANVSIDTSGTANVAVNYTSPSTSDLVDGAGTASCVPSSGSSFPVGITVVTCTATDAHGNKAAPVTFTVTVKQSEGNSGTTLADIIANIIDAIFGNPNGAPAGIIPVTGGDLTDLLCTNPAAFTVQLTDIHVIFNNLCNYQAAIYGQTADGLPGALPGNQAFVNGFEINVLKDGQVVKPLPADAGVSIEFKLPEGQKDANYAVMFWNGNEWVELTGEKTSDGYFKVSATEGGVFVLVKK